MKTKFNRTSAHSRVSIALCFLIIITSAVSFASCEKDSDNKGNSSTTDVGVIINGIKWATRNVDAPGKFAANPENSGMFYQWNRKVGWSNTDPLVNSNGGTTWDTTTPSGTEWESTNNPCPYGWRVPKFNEIELLLDTNYVINEWTQQGTSWYDGQPGIRFTDKSNGNSIFLPITYYRSFEKGLLIEPIGWGVYWSGSISGKDNSFLPWYFGFNSRYTDWSVDKKGTAYSVRCVAE